jgi:hypothetical protein
LDVGVYDYAFWCSKRNSKYDIGCLATDAGQLHELHEPPRNLSCMPLHQRIG